MPVGTTTYWRSPTGVRPGPSSHRPKGRAGYAKLHCLSNFIFQRGASSVDQLFERAKAMGYEALAITDECTLAGIVRAWQASEKHDVRLIMGAEFQIAQGPKLVLLVEDLLGYQQLCRLITLARRRADKGSYRLLREDLDQVSGLLALWIPERGAEAEAGRWLLEVFPGRLWIAAGLHFDQDDQVRLQQLQGLGAALDLPLMAAGDVHMHCRGRRALQDTITAIRHHVPVAEAGQLLFPNGERHLRTRKALGRCYPPELLAEALRIAERCTFSLAELRYHTPAKWYQRATLPPAGCGFSLRKDAPGAGPGACQIACVLRSRKSCS